jgi:hypothetical protein
VIPVASTFAAARLETRRCEMTDNAKQAWSEVGEKFASWGCGVAERRPESGPKDAAAAAEDDRELQRVVKNVVDELSRGASAIGKTFRDEQAKKELTSAISAVGDAITATVNEVVEGVRSGKNAKE